jgi:hypothetical protein
VAECVVDQFETVKIEAENGKLSLFEVEPLERATAAVIEKHPDGEACQRILPHRALLRTRG